MSGLSRLLFAAALASGLAALSGCVVAPAHGHARVWVPGHWAHPHVWVEGHWRHR